MHGSEALLATPTDMASRGKDRTFEFCFSALPSWSTSEGYELGLAGARHVAVGRVTLGPWHAEQGSEHALQALHEHVSLTVTFQERVDLLVLLVDLIAQKGILGFQALDIAGRQRRVWRGVSRLVVVRLVSLR